jgi:hypothetical protein
MTLLRFLDTPFSWAIAGFAIGLGLGVNSASVWLVAAGLGAFIVYLRLHGPAQPGREGWLFAAGPAFLMGWLVGFVVHGLIF